jgi:hypothetical protein
MAMTRTLNDGTVQTYIAGFGWRDVDSAGTVTGGTSTAYDETGDQPDLTTASSTQTTENTTAQRLNDYLAAQEQELAERGGTWTGAQRTPVEGQDYTVSDSGRYLYTDPITGEKSSTNSLSVLNTAMTYADPDIAPSDSQSILMRRLAAQDSTGLYGDALQAQTEANIAAATGAPAGAGSVMWGTDYQVRDRADQIAAEREAQTPPPDGTQPPPDGTQPPPDGTQPPPDGTQPPPGKGGLPPWLQEPPPWWGDGGKGGQQPPPQQPPPGGKPLPYPMPPPQMPMPRPQPPVNPFPAYAPYTNYGLNRPYGMGGEPMHYDHPAFQPSVQPTMAGGGRVMDWRAMNDTAQANVPDTMNYGPFGGGTFPAQQLPGQPVLPEQASVAQVESLPVEPPAQAANRYNNPFASGVINGSGYTGPSGKGGYRNPYASGVESGEYSGPAGKGGYRNPYMSGTSSGLPFSSPVGAIPRPYSGPSDKGGYRNPYARQYGEGDPWQPAEHGRSISISVTSSKKPTSVSVTS